MAPVEVESAIQTHPAVQEVAVVGLPDARWGELVCAAVVVRPGATLPTVDELRAHVSGVLIGAKQPRVVVQVDALPRTDATGQIRRRRLRDQIVAGAPRRRRRSEARDGCGRNGRSRFSPVSGRVGTIRMPSTDAGRPARVEALSRAKPVRRLHAITVLVVVVGLLVTAGISVGSWIVHDRNEDRLLDQRGHEVGTVAASSVGALQGQLSAASVAAEAGGDGALFKRLMGPLVGPDARFVSASVWPLDAGDPQPSVVLGSAPALAQQSAAARRAFLHAASGRTTISIRDLLRGDDRRLGYAYANPDAKTVAYVEAALPKNRRARIASDSAFADLDYALYLGSRPTPSHLIASSSGHGLRGQRTTTEVVPFGDSQILLIVSPRGELGGDLLAAAALGARRGRGAAHAAGRVRHRTTHPPP